MNVNVDGVYWDSSALIKRYIDESGSQTTKSLFKDNSRHFTATITHAEILCTFYRLKREGHVTMKELNSLTKAFLQDWSLLAKVSYDESVQSTALTLILTSSLRGADLIHLATCVNLSLNGLKLTFATFDKRLANAGIDQELIVKGGGGE